MLRSKYSTVLTIILIVVIIAIIVIATILAIGAYNDLKEKEDRDKIYASLQNTVNQNSNTVINTDNVIQEENIVINTVVDNTVSNSTTSGTTESQSRPKTQFYKDYPMVGYIKIPKTGVEYPILLDVTPKALEVGVGVMYPSNPILNEKGNVVIIGHNYRNGKFFADNDKLVIGDKIQITDLKGKTLNYTIYEISIIPETDTEYITRERGENVEISLSTCTDDGKARLVILAKVE